MGNTAENEPSWLTLAHFLEDCDGLVLINVHCPILNK